MLLGFYMDLVRCRRICAVRFSIHASHCCGERAKGPSAPPGVWYMGYGFAGMRRSSAPPTARRHTQVPPYIPGRTAGVVRRAGPMCPAAGTHRKLPDGLIRSDRVGRGLAPAAGTGSPECAGHRQPTPHGGTRRCRPTFPDGLPTWFVGRDRCVPPPVCTENHRTGRYVPTA